MERCPIRRDDAELSLQWILYTSVGVDLGDICLGVGVVEILGCPFIAPAFHDCLPHDLMDLILGCRATVRDIDAIDTDTELAELVTVSDLPHVHWLIIEVLCANIVIWIWLFCFDPWCQRWRQGCEGGRFQLLERPVDEVPARAQRLHSLLREGEGGSGVEGSYHEQW